MRESKGKFRFIMSLMSIFLAAGVNYGILFFLTPFITNSIGKEAYGFVSLAKNFANYAAIITVALNSVATRYISIEFHRNDILSANQYHSSLFFADVVVSGAVFLLSGAIIFFLDHFIVIPEAIVFDVKLLFILTMLNYFISSCGTVFGAATVIRNRLDISGLFKLASYVSEAVVLYIAFCQSAPHIFYVGLGLIVSSVVVSSMNYIYTRRTINQLKISIRYVSFKKVREVFFKGIWYSVNSLGNVLNHGLDLLVTNLMLSVGEMGELAIVKTVSTIGSALFQLSSQPFQPILLKHYAQHADQEIKSTLKLAIKVNGFFSSLFLAIMLSLGKNYFSLWTPNENTALLAMLALITAIGFAPEGAALPLYYVYVLTLKNKLPCIVTFCTGLCNVGAMYLLISGCNMGLECVVGTTTVISILYNYVFTPIYAAKCLGFSPFTFMRSVLRQIISTLCICAVLFFLSRYFQPSNWLTLFGTMILYSLIALIVYFLTVLSRTERSYLLHKLKR